MSLTAFAGRLVGVFVLAVLVASVEARSVAATETRFEISFPSTVRAQPITGRLFLLISRTNVPEVRLQGMWVNSPEIIAKDVHELLPGHAAIVDSALLGTPLQTLKELP